MKKLFFILFIPLFLSCNEPNNEKSASSAIEYIEIANPTKPSDPYYNLIPHTNPLIGPSSITRNLIEDKFGQFWFATWEGIFKYDGRHFTNITHQKKLEEHRVFSILEDTQGIIWFGTIGAGVYRYDGHDFKHLTEDDGLVNNDIGCIYEDLEGYIWFGTRVGLSKYDGEKFENFTSQDGLLSEDINTIIQDKSGQFWIGCRGKASYFNGEKFTEIKNKKGQSFMNVRSMILAQTGDIWLGGNDGLWSYNGSSFNNVVSNFIGNIYEDSKGNIWVSQSGTDYLYGMALHRYKIENSNAVNIDSSLITTGSGGGQVFGIIEDSSGQIWFGHERGVCKFDGRDFIYFD